MTPKEAGKLSTEYTFNSTAELEELIGHLRNTIDFLNGRYECHDMTLPLNITRIKLEGLLEYRKMHPELP